MLTSLLSISIPASDSTLVGSQRLISLFSIHERIENSLALIRSIHSRIERIRAYKITKY